MASRLCMLVLAFSIVLGCAYHHKPTPSAIIQHVPSPYQQYVAKNFDWSTIRRVVFMPVANQTAFPNVPGEIHTNLAGELQRAGNFDIVAATIEDPGVRARDVFMSGQFNELEAVRVAREYQADAILFANVTQYHAYNPPKLGVSMLMICPAEGIVIASLSGLWDSREPQTLQLAQAYLRQSQNWPRSLMGPDRVVEMPDVFQRFVCNQIASSFHPSSSQSSAGGVDANTIIPVEAINSMESSLPADTEIPPMPPPLMGNP